MRSLFLALALLIPASDHARVLFAFADPAITESSALVDLGSLMVTSNDSGDAAVLYVVDPKTGRTVGRTTYASSVRDVEALAPAGQGFVWAGDIGDNTRSRQSIRVYRVPVGLGDRRVDAPSYELVYPDGAHDAESLVAAPDGRLYVVTKGLLGGMAYAAPRRLNPTRPNRLHAIAKVDIWATDAAPLNDGKHVIVRGYSSATLYSFPAFGPLGSFDLPAQRQGEGISVGPGDRIRLSSEGAHSKVLQIRLPSGLRRVAPSPSPTVVAPAEGGREPSKPTEQRSPWPWVVGGGVLLAALLAGFRRRGSLKR